MVPNIQGRCRLFKSVMAMERRISASKNVESSSGGGKNISFVKGGFGVLP